MNDHAELSLRVHRLESIEAIHALKARYAALADAKYTAGHERQPAERMAEVAWQQALCFTDDAIWYGGEFGGDLQGHAQLHAWFQQSPWRYATHLYASPMLRVEGDHAEGTWRLWQLALREDDGQAVFLFGTTRETYRRVEGQGWLIASMAFDEVQLMAASSSSHPLVHRLSELGGPTPRSKS